jgi:hypothetical protein
MNVCSLVLLGINDKATDGCQAAGGAREPTREARKRGGRSRVRARSGSSEGAGGKATAVLTAQRTGVES